MNWVREDKRDGFGKRCCRHLGCGSPRNRRARSQASGEDRKFNLLVPGVFAAGDVRGGNIKHARFGSSTLAY